MTDKIIWVLAANCLLTNVAIFWLLLSWGKQDKHWKALLEKILDDWREDVMWFADKSRKKPTYPTTQTNEEDK